MANALITQLNNPAVLQQVNRRLAVIVSLLLTVACAYLLVEITWMLLPQQHSSSLPAPSLQTTTGNKQGQQKNFNALLKASIFGSAESSAVPAQTEAPETKLNLVLKGVLSATPASRASVIIGQGQSGNEDIYSAGDRMPGGVMIKEIHAEHVVLERNGQLEILRLQKESGADEISSSMISSSLTSMQSPAAALTEIRSNIMKNPTSFAEYAMPVIVKENGRQIGYRLQPQQKGAMLSELGLESSDVITEINGIKLDDPQNGISALRKLSTATSLDIVVRRNGADVPLNISLQ